MSILLISIRTIAGIDQGCDCFRHINHLITRTEHGE